MSILIKGMEMPIEEYGAMTITIYPNGHVVEYAVDIGRVWDAVPVPPHGRLIDADAIEYNMSSLYLDKIKMVSKSAIENMPTIIEGEDGGT